MNSINNNIKSESRLITATILNVLIELGGRTRRLLMAETPKPLKNRDTWLGDATLKFIAIWREKQADLKKIGPKKQLFQDWSYRLREEGVDKTAVQVQKKLENIKHLYKKTQT